MPLTKRAKMLTETQEKAILLILNTNGRYTMRNQALFLLSVKAGLGRKKSPC
jgi:hypothetical protein